MPEPTNTFQGHMAAWMAAYQAQATSAQGTPTPVQPKKEENVVEDTMMGGWRYEGKEKPVTPRVCTKCQWEKRNEQMEEPHRDNWCEACLNGSSGPGHEPEKHKPGVINKVNDVHNMNKAFFG